MARPSINVTYNKAIDDISILESYRHSSSSLDPKYQHFIAEIIMLRLFSILENSIKDTAMKVACQAEYRNGSIPNVNLRCKSLIDAENQFINYNRTKPQKLKWTKARFVKDSVKKIIPINEKFLLSVSNSALVLDEMRKIRNHIAHRTSSTYQDYKSVILSVFGANLKIQPGAYLISTKRLPVSRIDYYIRSVKIIITDITLG